MKRSNHSRLSGRSFVMAGLSYAVIAVLVGIGCTTLAPVPKTVLEQIESATVFAGKVSDSIADMTCTKFSRVGGCIEPGKPLMPEKALELHDKVGEAHNALSVAAGLGAGDVATCLGQQRTQLACLNAALAVLTEIDRKIIESKGTP